MLRSNFLRQGNKDKRYPPCQMENPDTQHTTMGAWCKESKQAKSKFAHEVAMEISNEDQSHWKKAIKEKYGGEDAWTKTVNNVYGDSVWKTIRNLWQIFSIHKVGNGHKISFWEDNWLGSAPLRLQHPDVFLLNQQQRANISEVWNNQGWDLSFRRRLYDWEMARFI